MNQEQIKRAINIYLDANRTDYAVMISGDWGSGKTYLLKENIYSEIKNKDLRLIYVSLIGLNSEEKLQKKIYENINPFYHTNKKSQIATEADALEQMINEEKELKLDIPQNIVLCFDDLERINSEFFETAMGYINTFIEHAKIKSIFMCDELKLTEKISDFKRIKEKYVRFTYHLKTDISSILNSGSLKIENYKNIDKIDKTILVDMFKKGKCTNVRTLLFTLSLLDSVLANFANKEIMMKNMDEKYAIDLITRFLCFVSIEFKNGRDIAILDKISVAIVTKNPLDLFDEGFEVVFDQENNKKNESKELETERKIIDDIVQRYFSDNPNNYFQFLSISNYVSQGVFDLDRLIKELNKIDISFYNKKLRDEKNKIIEITTNPYSYSNEEILAKIDSVPNMVEKGIFDLKECLQLYSNLLWISSFNIREFRITDEITNKFKKGAEKFIEQNNPEYIPHLTEFTDWSGNDEFVEKFRSFRKFIDDKNEELNTKFSESTTEDFIEAIKNNDELNAYNFLINISSDAYLSKKNAQSVFNALISALPKTTHKVFQGFRVRYGNDGISSSPMLRNEEKFIMELHKLIKQSQELSINKPNELSYVPIYLLGNYLQPLLTTNLMEIE